MRQLVVRNWKLGIFVGVHCMNPINSNVGVDPCVNPN